MTRRFPKTALLLCASLLASGGFAGAAFAQPPDGEPGDGPRGMGRRGHGPPPIEKVLERHADEFGLDADTHAVIREIAAKSREQEQPLSDQLRSLHDEMRAILDADAPNLDEVMQWADRIGAAETELKKRRLRTMLEIRALLTPEQRKKLVQIFEERRERRRGFKGERPPADPPE